MPVRWGMIGCGDVAEVKSGPGFQKADDSALVAVTCRNRDRAADYARRHGVPKFYCDSDELIGDGGIDAVYVATPPSSHCELALKVAAARKPCLLEKPMAMSHAECLRIIEAFRANGTLLFVAYYRRALPRFLKVRELLRSGTIGKVTSVHIFLYDQLAADERAKAWRFDPAIAGAGLFLDMGSHGFDLLDFFLGPIAWVSGYATNTGKAYVAEDVTAACFEFQSGIAGTGIWNFNADHVGDGIIFMGSEGSLKTPVFTDGDLLLSRHGCDDKILAFRNPPHVHQPLIQTIVDELLGRGTCESTGESAARSSWAMDKCLVRYYGANVATP